MSESEKPGSGEQFAEWKERYAAGDESAKELFRQISHIALLLAYDLIDKLRWYESETIKLTDAEIDERIPHISQFLEQLQTAYDHFADVDL
ncbi:MAG TPA: hypothetical protein VD788_18075 [Candidatus Polarisedimenticolaceae bacterium]|nr:hypothetical protein [Candidatus Polarisedimenticolaceae bacterium]